MNSMIELLQLSFFQHALIASLLASIACGIIGTYIVSKRMVFISGGITHASFGGIGLSYFLALNPLWGATLFGILSSWAVEYFRKRTKVREDSAIAILWSLGMALGIIFISITPGYAPDLTNFLFGNILTVSDQDLSLMWIITGIVVLFFTLFHRMILFVSFDEEYAQTNNAPVSLFGYVLMTLVALTIVINIRVAGIILVMSLMTIPQATAQLFSKRFYTLLKLSILIGFVGIIGGLLASYYWDIPSGASIIFTMVFLFGICKVIASVLHLNKSTV